MAAIAYRMTSTKCCKKGGSSDEMWGDIVIHTSLGSVKLIGMTIMVWMTIDFMIVK